MTFDRLLVPHLTGVTDRLFGSDFETVRNVSDIKPIDQAIWLTGSAIYAVKMYAIEQRHASGAVLL